MTQDINHIIKEADDRMYKDKLLNKKSAKNTVILPLKKPIKKRTPKTAGHTGIMRSPVVSLGGRKKS
jgi:hypothetical protein